MTIIYRIYANDGAGGPVNYSVPVATVTGLSFQTGPLAGPGDYSFAVRAADQATGLEEANTDASVRILIDGNGRDASGQPGAPYGVRLSASAGGGCRVDWVYRRARGVADPTGFRVTLSRSGDAPGAERTATVGYAKGRPGYRCRFAGPLEFGTYTAHVTTYNASGTGAGSTSTAEAGLSEGGLQMGAVEVGSGPVSP